MTVIVNNVSVYNTLDTPITALDGGDTLYVLPGVNMVQLFSGSAVTISGSSNVIYLQGLVSEITEAAGGIVGNQVYVAQGGMLNNLVLRSSRSQVQNDGSIVGPAPATIFGDYSLVTNTGTINGSLSGLVLTSTATSSTLDNSGIVSGRLTGVGVGADGGRIVNSGIIEGWTGIDATGAEGVVIVNTATGRITGSNPTGGEAAIAAGLAAEFRLTNHGLVEAVGGPALRIFADASAVFGATTTATVFNDGTISVSAGAAIQAGSNGAGQAVLAMTNSGLVRGDILLADGNDTYDGSDGTLAGTLVAGGGDDLLIGGRAAEAMSGDAGADTMRGGGGDDLLVGRADDDDLDGGEGNDRVRGGAGFDSLEGGAGADTLEYAGSTAGVVVDMAAGDAQRGDATGDAFAGFEAVLGSGNADTLLGGLGRETLDGTLGSDSLAGQDGADLLFGGGGNDTLDGGNGQDSLRGGGQNDLLLGGVGNDLLRGEADKDTLIGGTGVDTLAGGAGNDVFRFTALTDSGAASGTRDRILDFAQGADTIDLAAIDANAGGGTPNDAFAFIGSAAFSAAGQVRAFTQADGNTRIEVNVNAALAADMAIVVVGTVALQAADFVL
jgi:Ca2+-binding RTX toxin-like protein